MPVANASYEAIKSDPDGIYGAMAKALDEIASAYPKHRILVHTSSYVFGREVEARVGLATERRLLCPSNGAENKDMIGKKYSNRDDHTPYILISPACREGYDFEGDLCRIQVFTKCPFPSLGDPVIKKKLGLKGGKAWYAAKVATSIRQQYGRSTRNEKDYSVTFFLDKGLISFIERNGQLFPDEFHKAVHLGARLDWKSIKITNQLEIDGEKISY
jgi:Rad3-related DNA helicase